MPMSASFKKIYVSLFIATASAMLGMGIIEPILPIYAHHMGATGLVLGFIFSGFALSRGIFAPFMGQYSDSHGRRYMILCGLFFFVLLSFGYVIADSPWALMLVRTLQGLASVMITPIAQSYIGDIIPQGKEGKYMNLFFLSFFGGQAVGPVIGGSLSDNFGLAAPFYAMAFMAGISLALVYFLVPEGPRHTTSSGKGLLRFAATYRQVLGDRQMQGILLFMSSRGFYRWGFNTFFPILAVTRLDMSKTKIGIILSIYMLIGAIIQYPAGLLSDRFIKYRREIFFYGGILSPVMMFLIPLTGNFYLIFVMTLLMGLFSAISRASVVAIRTERGRIHGMGAVTGAFTASLSTGQIVGPLTFGAIADLFQLNYAFYLGGIVGLAGSVVSYLFLRKAAKEPLENTGK
jgi:MFS family permease